MAEHSGYQGQTQLRKIYQKFGNLSEINFRKPLILSSHESLLTIVSLATVSKQHNVHVTRLMVMVNDYRNIIQGQEPIKLIEPCPAPPIYPFN